MIIYLSHLLNNLTPSYGDRNKFTIIKKSDISKADVANDTFISSTVHIGTHIDMPYHFYEDGQTIEDYKASFWIFKKPLIIEIKQDELIIQDNLIDKLKNINNIGYDILIVKTGICHIRDDEKFWKENYGFHPDIYNVVVNDFPDIRVFGFDSISVSSFSNRILGREAHNEFLNPKNPILLLEDMDLRDIDENTNIKEIIVSPLRIANCDGLPCTIFGILND